MTMSEVILELKQQLAAALAAIKVKDEALETAWSITDPGQYPQEENIIAYALAIQPNDAALKT